MKNALIIFGGVSSEHDVSCVSATSVIRNIPKEKHKSSKSPFIWFIPNEGRGRDAIIAERFWYITTLKNQNTT